MENYNYSGGDDFLNTTVEDQQPVGNTGLGITAFILSLVGFLCCGPCTIVSIILALVERSKYGKMSGLGKAGLIIGIIGLVLWIVGVIAYVVLMALGVAASSPSYYYY